MLQRNGVRYIGHRYGILTIFVDRKLNLGDILDIESILLSSDIKPGIYDILDVSTYKPFCSPCMVGLQIEKVVENKRRIGTLGGFVVRKQSRSRDQICGLTAGHVATTLSRDGTPAGKYEFNIDGKDVNIDRSSLLTCSNSVDIAAFVISDDIKDKLPVKGKFRTRNNKKKACFLHDWSKNKFNNPFQVYIRGACTKFGLGMVTSCDLVDKDMQQYIFIEDENNMKFCRPGDSGAIVCIYNDKESHINAVALLIGGCIDKPQYVGLKLDFGINELSKRHGQMSLCDSV